MEKTALVRKYEAWGDPACVSSGMGDFGGISYGIYQFSSKAGVVQSFCEWACRYPNDDLANYGRLLYKYKANSTEFVNTWKKIGENDSEGFSELQDEYAISVYYNPAADILHNVGYDIETKTDAMQAVLISRAVQYGSGNMAKLYAEAVHSHV